MAPPALPERINEDVDEQLRWRALSDPTRRAILDALGSGPATTGRLARGFPMSRIAVMKHLDILESARLITSEKRGRERWHFVNLAPLQLLHRRWATPLGEATSDRMLQLKSTLETRPPEAPMANDITTIDIAVSVDIDATASMIFTAVVDDPGAWWGPPFMRPDATGLECRSELGAALIERWPGGAMVMATVTGIEKDHWVQLIGPFHLGPATATADFRITPVDEGCRVDLSFRGTGLIDPEMVEAFNGGWRSLISERLKAFAEDGIRSGVNDRPIDDTDTNA